ncbi:MerR family transcriptional regulator [Phytomonospora endophytica]|uniref:DNA-binding transcriptional MerR regulator n=1 Tax=Phytomonospora endophytica TaxID=714109 RepID=A0A841FCD4_9ACTN|nr:MerR family transcriptional regulator [Phytomonospora endophytica]MBB6034951.1 DNA-binding transcriptional MerR regulator [Phytomonospora endophytica]GIG70653.1 MerR family transcriptional regulator [Phytomonospora endophytica]
MRIGELARLAGVSIRSLRYYEEQGLLAPARTPAGYRIYADGDIERVARIQLLYAAGMRSSCIADVLGCVNGDGTEAYAEPAPDLIAGLIPVRERIVRQIAELGDSLTVLDRILGAARGPLDVTRT